MTWNVPAEVSGNPEHVRLSVSLLDRDAARCAEFAALKARPKVVPDGAERRYPPWETFSLRLVSEVVDAVEFDGVSVEDAMRQVISGSRSGVHPGLASWLRHAASAYLAADGRLAAGLAGDGIELRPQSRPRVVQHSAGPSVRMLTS
jgi:hypothetical protein